MLPRLGWKEGSVGGVPAPGEGKRVGQVSSSQRGDSGSWRVSGAESRSGA